VSNSVPLVHQTLPQQTPPLAEEVFAPEQTPHAPAAIPPREEQLAAEPTAPAGQRPAVPVAPVPATAPQQDSARVARSRAQDVIERDTTRDDPEVASDIGEAEDVPEELNEEQGNLTSRDAILSTVHPTESNSAALHGAAHEAAVNPSNNSKKRRPALKVRYFTLTHAVDVDTELGLVKVPTFVTGMPGQTPSQSRLLNAGLHKPGNSANAQVTTKRCWQGTWVLD
jgi:hypothetical protein